MAFAPLVIVPAAPTVLSGVVLKRPLLLDQPLVLFSSTKTAA